MEENVRKELEALEMMVFNWKDCYLRDATPDGNNECLLEEFQGEISIYVGPYIRRLFQCEYITAGEAQEFLDFCDRQVDDLLLRIQEVETPPAKPGVWQRVVEQAKFTRRKETG